MAWPMNTLRRHFSMWWKSLKFDWLFFEVLKFNVRQFRVFITSPFVNGLTRAYTIFITKSINGHRWSDVLTISCSLFDLCQTNRSKFLVKFSFAIYVICCNWFIQSKNFDQFVNTQTTSNHSSFLLAICQLTWNLNNPNRLS